MQADLEVLLRNASAALATSSEIIGEAGPPRFELFHGANSICSQKVRVVLAQHAIAYVLIRACVAGSAARLAAAAS